MGFHPTEVTAHLVLSASFVGDREQAHQAHRIRKALEGIALGSGDRDASFTGVAFRILLAKEGAEWVGHGHEAEVAGHEVVQFTALTRHANTGFHEIEVTGLKDEVRQLAEEGHEGILPAHGQHGMKTVR